MARWAEATWTGTIGRGLKSLMTPVDPHSSDSEVHRRDCPPLRAAVATRLMSEPPWSLWLVELFDLASLVQKTFGSWMGPRRLPVKRVRSSKIGALLALLGVRSHGPQQR